MMAEQMETRPKRREYLVDHGLPGIDSPTSRIEGARRFVRQKYVDVCQRLALHDLVSDEVAALVVATLAELERASARLSAARRWQCGGRRVTPARSEPDG